MTAPTSDTFVSVVAVFSNAAGRVRPFLTEVHGHLGMRYANYEIVAVDDGSRDGTAGELRKCLGEVSCLRVIRLSRPFGRDAAILAGLDSCIGDFVVILQPGTDPPDLISEAVSRCRAGAGVVVGRPDPAPPVPWWSVPASTLFHAYCRRVLKVGLSQGGRTFFCLSRAALNAILAVRSRVWHLRYLASIIGFEAEILPYRPLDGDRGKSPRSFAEDLADGLGIVLSNSKHPLRFVSLLGVAASGLNLLYMLYVVVIYLMKPDVAAGWTTLSMQSSVMFFLIFVILTVLSEYVAIVLEESQNRPAYLVAAEEQSNVLLKDPNRRNIVTESK